MSDLNPNLHEMSERHIVERIVAEFHREVDEITVVLSEGGQAQLLVIYAGDIREVAQRIVYGEPLDGEPKGDNDETP